MVAKIKQLNQYRKSWLHLHLDLILTVSVFRTLKDIECHITKKCLGLLPKLKNVDIPHNRKSLEQKCPRPST